VRSVGCDRLPAVACGRIHFRLLHPYRRRGAEREIRLSAAATPADRGLRRIPSCRKAKGARIICRCDNLRPESANRMLITRRHALLQTAAFASASMISAAPAFAATPSRTDDIDKSLRAAAAAHAIPGVVAMAAGADSILYEGAIGS